VRLVGSLAQLVEQLAFNQLVAGSNPARPTTFSSMLFIDYHNLFNLRFIFLKVGAKPSGSLAQLVEQLAFNQLVAGSNPARPTTFSIPIQHNIVNLYLIILPFRIILRPQILLF
tara:strand:- start:7679 stop:8020 length:342 start_codon:yes stop_codon:yes gene_type:complete